MLFIFISAAFANDIINTQAIQTIKQDTSDINCTLKGIELFLSDKTNYKTYCSAIKWTQPDLSVYIEKGASQLPSECVALIPPPPTTEQAKTK